MELPIIDIFAKDVAEKALDGFTYEGKTLREWVEILAKQQPCEDCISRQEVLDILKDKWNMFSDANDAMQESIDTIEAIPSVTPKTSCDSCREQVLKHLEKEDWADTVNCVMNMPFMKGEENVLDQIRAEIAELEEGISSYHNDRPLVFKNEVLQIIDKYKKTESEK